MTEAIGRRKLIGWVAALLGALTLGACQQGGMFGRRPSDEENDSDSRAGGGMSGGSSSGGSGGGGY